MLSTRRQISPMQKIINMSYKFYLVLLLAGCVNSKKATRYMNEHKDKLAELCAENFPAKDSIIVRDSIRLDTIYEDGEIVQVWVPSNPDTILVKAQCPPHKLITRTVRRDSIIIRVDRAKETMLINNANQLNEALIKVTSQRDELKARVKGKVLLPWWWLLIAGIGLAGWAYYRIKAGALNKVLSKLKKGL